MSLTRRTLLKHTAASAAAIALGLSITPAIVQAYAYQPGSALVDRLVSVRWVVRCEPRQPVIVHALRATYKQLPVHGARFGAPIHLEALDVWETTLVIYGVPERWLRDGEGELIADTSLGMLTLHFGSGGVVLP